MADLGKIAIAMLRLLAYQNRDTVGGIDRRTGEHDLGDPESITVDQLFKGVAATALGDILEQFRNVGAGSAVDSWVSTGPNEPIEPQVVEAVMDEDTLTFLSIQTGLTRDELIVATTRHLPEAINNLTPHGDLRVGESRQGPDETSLLDDVAEHAN